MKKYLTFLIFLSLTVVGNYPHIVNAQSPSTPVPLTNCTTCNLGYTPLEPIPGINSANLTQPNSLPLFLNDIFQILIILGALLAVLMLTIGGVQYMVSGTAGGKNQGIERAKAALWGVLLIASSWLILNTINPKLLTFTLIPCSTGVNCTVTGTGNPTPTQVNTCVGASCATADQQAAANLVNLAKSGAALTPEQQAELSAAIQTDTTLQATQANGCANSGGQLYNNVNSGADCSSQQAQGNQNSITGYNHCTNVPSGGYCLTP
jgi:hypothetical protein